ncbi:MAG: phosphoribosylformylglycinamidine synthase subunit PurQ, partial [Thermoguttaceae bacterium]|nr:phosphoribosylformylglycinamidine synthase subunit PurQ [Thermoguttaceae bacterium]
MKANKPNVLILRAPGTNCDFETAYAFELAGASAERVHVNRLLEDPSLLDRFEILCFPGGFSFGDDVAAGRILATELRHNLFEPLHRFKEAGRLILGICNGFQILVKSGLLLADDEAQPKATLTWNKSGVYTDRWAHLTVDGGKCVFLKGITSLYLPVAHAEGRFVGRDEAVLDQLQANGQLALRYVPDENPNGAERNVAGLCDETGRVV